MDEVLFEIHQLTHRFADGTTAYIIFPCPFTKGKKLLYSGTTGQENPLYFSI